MSRRGGRDKQGLWPDNVVRSRLDSGRARGAIAEDAVMAAIADIADRRVHAFRKATALEDRTGVDIVITLQYEHVETVYLQVKASSRLVSRWRKKHQNDKRIIEVVVVPDPDRARPAVRDALSRAIWEALRRSKQRA